MQKSIRYWLSNTSGFWFSMYASIAAFSTYFCMYAWRKPFAVGTFDDLSLWGIDYKIILVISQVLGYTLSKFIGIKLISEMKHQRRALAIILCILTAQVALLGFAFVKPPYNFFFLFLNGLPLGLIWGLVFSFVEGRRYTEVLAAGLSVSFIVSTGVVKSVGSWLIVNYNVSEFLMPALVGFIFMVPLLISVFFLNLIPQPDKTDEELRTRRVPMNRQERWTFFVRLAPGLVALVLAYVFFTVMRDFRDNFSAELWKSLGYENKSHIFTTSELPIAIIVLVLLGSTILIKNNVKAFWINHLIVFIGGILIGLGTIAFQYHFIDSFVWMVIVGLGLYLGYTPFNSIFFERLIASFRQKSNAGFLIYLADAFGYLGSCLILIYKDFFSPTISWLDFFIQSSYLISVLIIFAILFSFIYFYKVIKTKISI